MRVRRLRKTPPHLEITAFINLIVVLVPFLLSTAVFTRLSVMDLDLPAQNSGAGGPEKLQPNKLLLEVIVRRDAVDVTDRIGGLIQRIEHRPQGPDLARLSALALQLKQKFPQQTDATLLVEPDTPYDTIVQVMDTLRATYDGHRAPRRELFPHIAIGDAPLVRKGAAS